MAPHPQGLDIWRQRGTGEGRERGREGIEAQGRGVGVEESRPAVGSQLL